MSTEATLSKRARKKLARETPSSGARSESVSSDVAAKKDESRVATPGAGDEDGELKLRDGTSPFIEVVQKKIRNLSKRKTRLEMLEAQAKDSSAPALKPDQVEALSHLPAVSAVVTELADLLASLKKFEQSQNDVLLSHHRKFQSDLRDAEAAKQVAVREAEERGREEARAETKSVLGFLRFASYQREVQSPSSPEGAAVESVLIGVYQGGEKAFETALKLSEGAREPVGADSTFTYDDVKEMVLRFHDPTRGQTAEEPVEHVNGDSEEPANGTEAAGYQVTLSETAALDNGTYAKEALDEPTGDVTFFQTSELETELYNPIATTSQGISFLQESELGSSQPHEDDTSEQPNHVAPSTHLPPIQTLTETQSPSLFDTTASIAGAETGQEGNAAAETMLNNTPQKTDWAMEEASPTTETAPLLPEKKKDDEWTMQSSRHARHQSQNRGRGGGGGRGGPRGEGWRGGGEGRGRGGYRGRGERGASNGERRGSYRGGERGRGRGGAPAASANTSA